MTLIELKTYLTNEIRDCDMYHFYGESEEVNEQYAKNDGRRDALQEILDILNRVQL